jgi:uncharacterized membrane protein
MKVVFCCFGKETGAGFLALLVSPARYCINSREYQIVIVPTAPVPIGGGLLFVPLEVVQPTELSVEGLMSIYVSMGISAEQAVDSATGPHFERPFAGVLSSKHFRVGLAAIAARSGAGRHRNACRNHAESRIRKV